MFKLAYCEWLTPKTAEKADSVLKQFLIKAKAYDPKLMDKQKMHLLLHLPENIMLYGPSFSFNTERFEHSNAHAHAKHTSFKSLLFPIDVNISMALCVNATFMEIERPPAEILQQDLPN